MTISYNWLCDYLPTEVTPERLEKILTSVGLEVEKFEKFEAIKGGLKGLVIGEVLTAEKHPNADKLTITTVNVGTSEPLQIVCGAPNVAVGQKVVVAKMGTTIFPTNGLSTTMKLAKIRSVESHGMICSEDEIGLGTLHNGIMVLEKNAKVGTDVSDYFQPYEDWIYEVGITPNRMEAMSHWGIARDVSAYLNHHDNKIIKPKLPIVAGLKTHNKLLSIEIQIENKEACQRYSGVSIAGIEVKESPKWMRDKLNAIGIRSINNIVDITNFIQHETGQPLHAFDADEIKGKKIIVKNLPEATSFITLDEKERKLDKEDLMICNSEEPMCFAGVYGGLHSGVTNKTKNIFLESAWFHPITIRKTSFRHSLRTDAATRFEKNVDISNTVQVLKRAALLITELCGGKIASEVQDVYPNPLPKIEIGLKYQYLKKLSGKNYHPDAVKNILTSLGFVILKNSIDELQVSVPYHKPDVSIPADLVEEILRIDGLDNIDMPKSIRYSPSLDEHLSTSTIKEKAANYLTGLGFHEILTNSITNNAYYDEEELKTSVKMLNSLSTGLNILRPSMLETGLESIAWNLNRKNNTIKFFEFGKTYATVESGKYTEQEHLCLYVSGNVSESGWRSKSNLVDFHFIKGITQSVFKLLGIPLLHFEKTDYKKLSNCITGKINRHPIVTIAAVNNKTLKTFDIKQEVFIANFYWDNLLRLKKSSTLQIEEISKFPAVHRDLALVVARDMNYVEIENVVHKLKLKKLQEQKLFDIFESEKLGANKKSLAVSFTFLDEEKTLTDKEIDGWMNQIMASLENELQAEIRK